MRKPVLIIFLMIFGSITDAAPSRQTTFYVAPDGSDRNPGTTERPLASLAGARDALRETGLLGRESLEVIFRAGVYELPETVVFTAADSGTPAAPVLYRSERGAEVVISGGQRLELQWQPLEKGIVAAKVPADLVMDQFYLNGRLQHMARYPNYDPETAIFGGYAADAFSTERAAQWTDPAGGYLHALHQKRWASYHYLIKGKNPDGSLRSEGGWQTNRKDPMHARYRFVENIREELDARGEWFHDRKAGQLLFYPPKDVDLENATVSMARLRCLVELRGSQDKPVRNIGFSGLTFRHATRTFMDTNEPIQRSDWAIYRGGALFFEGTEDCILDRCNLEQLGGNAVFVSNYNRRVKIQTCRIQGCGASGVAFLGNPAAVRSSRTKEERDIDHADLDRLPGPLTDDYPIECTVEDCLITDLGRVEKQVAGVEISMARRITVRNCSIYNVPRAGIDIGTGRWGGHLIEGCDVFDTVLETGDHGSFNSWGRDRFLEFEGRPDDVDLSELSLLDNMEPTVIRNSRWRCDHGWDIDLDDGSSNYHIYKNLLLNGGLKFRQGFRRYAWNNVIVNDALHPHVWFANSLDVFKHNIVMGPYRPARMREEKWGLELDYNFFTSSEADRSAYLAHGADEHSVVGDAKFMNPAKGDFRVAEDSPALAIGFKNFPMDQFGVRDPKLRSMARTPDIPRLRNVLSDPEAIVYDWLGGKIRDLQGGEYSAWGISSEAGGILVLYAPGWMAIGQANLQKGDLIYSCGGAQVKNVEDLSHCIQAAPSDQPLTLSVRREGRGGGKIVFPERPPVPRAPER